MIQLKEQKTKNMYEQVKQREEKERKKKLEKELGADTMCLVLLPLTCSWRD